MASSTRSALWSGVLAVGVIGAGLACAQAPAGNGAPAAQPADSAAQAPPADAGERVTAKWVQKKTRFVYQGFTTHYSCDGLRDQLGEILRQLGARSDMKLNSIGCVHGFGQPEPFPMVDATFYVLVPANTAGTSGQSGGAGAGGTDGGASSSAPLEAQWQTVQLQLGNTPLDQAGMCELLEQVNHKIVPLFSPRKVDFRSSCVPHQLTVGATTLAAEVLKPVPSGPGTSPKA